jgi:hypothetical protein
MLIIGLTSEAQPQYWNALPTAGANVFPFNTLPATGKRVQWIVGANEFALPGPAPANNITSIWFRPNAACNATYTTLTVRMALVPITTFITVGAFYTGAMTIVRQQNTTITQPVALTWTEIPLTTPFTYNPAMNLIIEVYQCGFTGTGFNINQQAWGTAPNYRRQYSDASSPCGSIALPTGGDLNVPAIGISMVASVPCPTPTAQPTGLILTAVSQVQINGSFSAAVPAPTNYLVVRYPSGAVPVNPVNGTNYLVGAALGTGTVISNSNATAFTTAGLAPGTTYDFYVYSHNTGACATTYLTAAPLFGSRATLPCAGPPTLTCPANITVNNTPGLCGANVTYPPATAGGSPVPLVTYSIASGSFFPKGTTTVIATATSVCGTTTCSFTITVVDNQPPTITCPANVTVNNTPNLCSAVVTFPAPTALDNCPFPGSVPLSITQNSSNTVTAGSVSCNAGGIHTDNSYWRAYNLGPLALTGPFTINTVTFGVELATGTGGTQPVLVRIYTPAAFPVTIAALGPPLYSQTFAVPNQTLSLYTATFTTPPTVAANALLVIEIFTPAGPGNSFFIGSNAQPETAPSYLSATACGVPNPVTVASLGFPNMHTIINAAGLVSNPASSITQIAGIASGGVFPVGVTTNTFRVTDGAGLTATCSMTVTVVDNQAPAVTCPANIPAQTDANQCYATVPTPNPTTSDNCAVTQITWSITPPPPGAIINSPATGINYVGTRQFGLNGTTGSGVSTVTYTVKDAAGNTTTCSYTVTVTDAWIPVIGAGGQPSNQFVCVGSNGTFSVTASVPAGNPLTYQWQSWTGTAWADIIGATASTLPLNAVTFSMNTNSYRCKLTGRCSEVISGFATLYVNPLPTISLLASGPLALLPGQSLNITTVVSPGGGSYQWQKFNVTLSLWQNIGTGASLSGLTVDDIGSYRCVYTDLNGCVATSAVMVVTGEPSCNLWVYANPNQGLFQVRFFNSVNEPVTVNIYNSGGSRIYSRAVTTGLAYSSIPVDIQSQPAGVYIVEVINSTGKRACNAKEKFIKVL